jgi:hypothetical protein
MIIGSRFRQETRIEIEHARAAAVRRRAAHDPLRLGRDWRRSAPPPARFKSRSPPPNLNRATNQTVFRAMDTGTIITRRRPDRPRGSRSTRPGRCPVPTTSGLRRPNSGGDSEWRRGCAAAWRWWATGCRTVTAVSRARAQAGRGPRQVADSASAACAGTRRAAAGRRRAGRSRRRWRSTCLHPTARQPGRHRSSANFQCLSLSLSLSLAPPPRSHPPRPSPLEVSMSESLVSLPSRPNHCRTGHCRCS